MGAEHVAICYDVERPLARQPQQPTPEGLLVAEVFRALRLATGFTQEEMAREVNLTLSGYRPYEQGKRQLRIEQIPTFAKAFRVSVETLSARLGLSSADAQQARISECADLMRQLEGEPPAVIETVMRWWRDSIQIAKLHQQARDN